MRVRSFVGWLNSPLNDWRIELIFRCWRCRRDCKKQALACFSSSAIASDHSAASPAASCPPTPVGVGVEQGLVIPIRHRHPCFVALVEKFIPASGRSRDGGAGGIRTLDTAFQPYNGLANRRLQPLGHSTIRTSAALPAKGLCWLPLRAGSLSAANQSRRGKGALLP